MAKVSNGYINWLKSKMTQMPHNNPTRSAFNGITTYVLIMIFIMATLGYGKDVLKGC